MSFAQLNKFDELFEELQDLNLNKVETFVSNALETFDLIRKKLSSSDQEDRTQALELALEFQKKLEFFSEKAQEKNQLLSVNKNEMASFSNHFVKEEWETLENSKQQIEEYAKTLQESKESRSGDIQRKRFRQRV